MGSFRAALRIWVTGVQVTQSCAETGLMLGHPFYGITLADAFHLGKTLFRLLPTVLNVKKSFRPCINLPASKVWLCLKRVKLYSLSVLLVVYIVANAVEFKKDPLHEKEIGIQTRQTRVIATRLPTCFLVFGTRLL